MSVSKAIKTYPAIGWVRADAIATTAALQELAELQTQNLKLTAALTELKARIAETPVLPELASIDSKVTFHGEGGFNNTRFDWELEFDWRQTFGLLAPFLLGNPMELFVKNYLGQELYTKAKRGGFLVSWRDQEFQTVKVQLLALGFIEVIYSATTTRGAGLFWNLTPLGKRKMIEFRAVRTSGQQNALKESG